MSNRLSSYTGQKYTFTIGEIAARGNLADALDLVSLKFANNTEFMPGSRIGDILADFTRKLYISMVPASGDLEGDFIGTLTKYWESRRGDYFNMYTALSKNYDPIQNYSMTETGLDGKKLDGTTDTNIRSGSSKVTETPTGQKVVTTAHAGGNTVTETPSGSEKTTTTPSGSYAETETEAGGKTTTETESRTTYNDTANFKPAIETVTEEIPNTGNEKKTDHTFNQYKTEEEKTFTGRKTVTETEYMTGTQDTETESFTGRKTETDTTYNQLTDTRTINNSNTMAGSNSAGTVSNSHEVTEHFFERSGNIGVTTSQQMIESEIELRYKYNLWYMFIREFITRFTY